MSRKATDSLNKKSTIAIFIALEANPNMAGNSALS